MSAEELQDQTKDPQPSATSSLTDKAPLMTAQTWRSGQTHVECNVKAPFADDRPSDQPYQGNGPPPRDRSGH